MFNKKSIAIFLLGLTFAAASNAADSWRGQLDQSAGVLQTGDYSKSLIAIDRVIGGMVERLGGDNESFATILTHKALASAGLGNIDDALWYWCIAQQIEPQIANKDLSSFGAPGEFLKRHPITVVDPATGAGATAPKVLKQVIPTFPAGASRFALGGGDLVVQVIVDKNGTPTLPHIIHGLPAPSLSYIALEALKRWKFQAATRNGEPVASVFNLQVHYKL